MNELETSIKWPYKLESSFTTSWLKSLKEKWYFCYKIPDWSLWQKPYDVIVVTDKNTYHIEIKLIKGNKFPLSNLRPNQWASMRKIDKLLWSSILVIYSSNNNNYKIIPFSKIKNLDKQGKIELVFKK